MKDENEYSIQVLYPAVVLYRVKAESFESAMQILNTAMKNNNTHDIPAIYLTNRIWLDKTILTVEKINNNSEVIDK